MKAFVKTLFGDLRNLATVACIVAAAAALIEAGLAREAVYAVPLLVMAAVAWLAHH